jgi:uncharacterized protein (DUF305 family)
MARCIDSPSIGSEGRDMKLLTLVAIAALPAVALAQGGHSGHGKPGAAQDTPATQAYRAANAKMHKEMDLTFSNDADVDFVRAMIPHHRGAIDMARVALQHGRDEQTRKWASDVIREQEREIAEMQAWLQKRGIRP